MSKNLVESSLIYSKTRHEIYLKKVEYIQKLFDIKKYRKYLKRKVGWLYEKAVDYISKYLKIHNKNRRNPNNITNNQTKLIISK